MTMQIFLLMQLQLSDKVPETTMDKYDSKHTGIQTSVQENTGKCTIKQERMNGWERYENYMFQ